MIYEEKQQDLFTVSSEYCLAQCISADFACGRGIAVDFNIHYNIKNILTTTYPDYIKTFKDGDIIVVDRVINLITKLRYWEKPNYKSITIALEKCRNYCVQNNITKLAMPKIGCGLDHLQWYKVSDTIKELFKDTDIEILVCIL